MRDTEIVTSSAMWAFTIVAVSCIFGLGISFFGFSTRRLISATAFTVLGCTNKLLTLLVNSLVWSHHASLMGQACVLVSILGGVLYSEYAKDDAAEHAKKAKPPPAAPEAEDKEQGVPLATVAQAPGARRAASRVSAGPIMTTKRRGAAASSSRVRLVLRATAALRDVSSVCGSVHSQVGTKSRELGQGPGGRATGRAAGASPSPLLVAVGGAAALAAAV